MEQTHPLKQISCIVPVYNEGPRVANVLAAVTACPYVDEVIVVNDGSTDSTKDVLEHVPGITLINQPHNTGKSSAVMTGMMRARNDIVMMIDSDLIGLTAEEVSKLAEPVLSGTADMTLSMRKNSLQMFKMLGMDFVTGERVFHKSIFPNLSVLGTLPGFGLESYINTLAIEKKLRLKVVDLGEVITPRKRVKEGWLAGTLSDWAMVMQIVRYLKPSGMYRLAREMRRLRV